MKFPTTGMETAIAEAISNQSDTVSLYGESADEHLPKELLNVKGLKHLSIKYFYRDIPQWIIEIPTLESLEIEETRSCREVVNNLWKLQHLKKLKLAHVS